MEEGREGRKDSVRRGGMIMLRKRRKREDEGGRNETERWKG